LRNFHPAPFHEIAVRLFGRKRKASWSASRTYCILLNLIDAIETPFDAEKKSVAETLEVEAVDAASIYEDVVPALAELKSMGSGFLWQHRFRAGQRSRSSSGIHLASSCPECARGMMQGA